MYGLTRRQAQCLGVIEAAVSRTGTSPSYAEIAAALGLSSKSKGYVHQLVRALTERGYVRRIQGRYRSIALLRGAHVEPKFAMCADIHERLGQ